MLRINTGLVSNKNKETAQPSGGNVDTPALANGGKEDVNIVCELRRDVGIPIKTVNERSRAALREHIRGRFHRDNN